jgi:hypothetical protein
MRLYTPLIGLAHGWELKLPLAAAVAVLVEGLTHIGALYGELLDADPLLILLIASLLVTDVVTGIAAARKRREPIGSRGLRRTGYKVIEYAALGFVAVSISNAFAAGPLHLITDGFDDAALLYIAFTEAFSVVENIAGTREKAVRILRSIQRVWTSKDRVVLEEIVEPLDRRFEANRPEADDQEVSR